MKSFDPRFTLATLGLLATTVGAIQAQVDEIVALAIDETGAVGIGTERPDAPFEVLSPYTDQRPPNILATQVDDPARIVARRISLDFDGKPSAPLNTDLVGLFGASGWDPEPSYRPSISFPPGSIQFRAVGHWGDGFGVNMSFWTTKRDSRDDEQRMVITHDGKVGIGVDEPEAALHVDGSLRVSHGGANRDLAFDLWPAIASSGESCAEACDPSFCLGSYQDVDDGFRHHVPCSNKTDQRLCMCVGRR